jgi:hypothetical protein
MGVIAKRPIANVAWRYRGKPAEPYYQAYWSRLKALDYPFLHGPADPRRDGAALHAGQTGRAHGHRGHDQARSVEGKAALLAAGPLSRAETDAIRDRWKAIAAASWSGQI